MFDRRLGSETMLVNLRYQEGSGDKERTDN